MMARERYWWHGSKEDHQRIVESAGAAVAGNGAVERGPPALGQCRHHPRVLNAGAATGVLAATTADAATGAGVLPSSAAGTAIRELHTGLIQIGQGAIFLSGIDHARHGGHPHRTRDHPACCFAGRIELLCDGRSAG